MASRVNAEWHAANRMPKNASREQRIAWHVEHKLHCACREVPASLQDEVLRRIAGRGASPP